jgi:hypothetical protein
LGGEIWWYKVKTGLETKELCVCLRIDVVEEEKD